MNTPFAFHSRPLALLRKEGKIKAVHPAPMEGKVDKRSEFPAQVGKTQYHVMDRRVTEKGERKRVRCFSNSRRLDFESKKQKSIAGFFTKK